MDHLQEAPDPTSDYLKGISHLITGNKLDIGFAFDLDGDRLVVVDNKGEKLNPDITLLLCVASALKLGMRKFVTSIDTSVCIEKFIKALWCEIGLFKVGEANVVKKMIELMRMQEAKEAVQVLLCLNSICVEMDFWPAQLYLH